jgi:hypothetical protein
MSTFGRGDRRQGCFNSDGEDLPINLFKGLGLEQIQGVYLPLRKECVGVSPESALPVPRQLEVAMVGDGSQP